MPCVHPGGDAARVVNRWYNVRRRSAAYGYCTDSAPKEPTRTDGETSVKCKMRVHTRSRGILPCKEKTSSRWPRTRLQHASELRSSPESRGPKGQAAASMGSEFRRRDPLRPSTPRTKTVLLDHGLWVFLGRGRRRPAYLLSNWRALQGDGAAGGSARPDRDDFCHRDTLGATGRR